MQIRTQFEFMSKVAAKELKTYKTEMFINKESDEICKLVRMKPNGGCMFGAILHQTNGQKSSLKSFSSSIDTFRKDIVQHILKDSSKYIGAIRNTIWDSRDNLSIDKSIDLMEVSDEYCLNYLETELPNPKIWGGYEVLQAASDMLRINILIISQQNGFRMFEKSFNVDHDKTIIIAYKQINRATRSGDQSYNHYESVYEVDGVYLTQMIEQIKNSIGNFISL